MTSSQVTTTRMHAAKSAGHPAMPTVVLENLAARFRPGGLCLILLNTEGAITWHDPAAPAFFQRFVVPLMSSTDPAEKELRTKIGQLTAHSPVTSFNNLPGVALAGFPNAERRNVSSVLILAGKSSSFRLTEDIVRICGRLALDGIWLHQQAEELPAYGDEAIARTTRLLLATVRDQVRLSNQDLELTSLSGQLANTYEELSLIYQISGGMRINRRPADFFKQACLDAIDVMGVRGMGVALCTGDAKAQDPVLYGRLSLPSFEVERMGHELLNWMTRKKASLLINDLTKDPQFGWLHEFAKRLLVVPLQRGDKVLGCLFCVDKESGEFDSVDSKLLTSIANESAIYLENAVLFDDVHGLMMGLLHSLTSAVDAKDAYTCGHSERVALFSKLLASSAGIDEQQVERIYMAGLLHDVGKIGVPEEVLKKPGRLTVEEFEQMKKHPAIGARILHDVKQIQDIIPGVLYHHERYDGRGYPDGLAGQNIPLMGRIICLADCFDAMTSTRTYRKALPLEATLADIRRCSGTQFDPALTEVFLKIPLDKLREILRHQEPARADVRTVVSPAVVLGKAA